jgi:alpha-L-fucosidase 2
MKTKFAIVLFALLPVTMFASPVLWYDKPADSGKRDPILAGAPVVGLGGGESGKMNEALPIGGGKFGGLIYGAPEREYVVLNDITFWTGSEISTDNYDLMGWYQMLGELLVAMPGHTNAVAYRRALDIGTAIHTVSYKIGAVTYTRETFASHPGGVIAMRFTADKPASLTGTVILRGTHKETTHAAGGSLTFAGELPNKLKYETKLVALHDGGTLHTGEGRLEFAGCNSVTLFVAAGTDYVMDYNRHYRGEDPGPAIERRLAAAQRKNYGALKLAHIADYQSLFNRVALNVGATPADRLALPTDRRKAKYAGDDPELEALLFQYGRYLMISCSRPGGLPANLQGLWCDSNNPPWHSDYHANINIQMNYWPAEPANLSECHTTLFDLITSQLPAWRKATPGGAGRGWMVRTSHGINGDQGWQWDVPANAWYCQHFWWHYQFTGDKAWLKSVAYPVIKETCEFWAPRLKKLPDGKLVVPNGWSPEHGPWEDGVSYCQEIVWDLFNNYVAASETLGVDADYRAKIAGMRDALLVPKIGKWGQLQEWMVDRDDPNDHHRHTSHLFAVYPGQQINSVITPALAKAASVSLGARGMTGDSHREWACAWRSALWARLHNGEKAYEWVRLMLSGCTTINLFGNHPPVQLDGNFGITAGICEMLMQSHAGEIELLPALPAAWPTGKVTGLRARGGFTVDIEWKDGKVVAYRVQSTSPCSVKVRVGDKVKTIASEKL